jgi:hypothetical protein
MKPRILFLIVVSFIVASCRKEKEEKIKEVPDEIIRTETCATLYDRIFNLLPEERKAEIDLPSLLSGNTQKKIILTAETEVYITFIAEEAGYKNTVGWYSYPLGKEPVKASELNLHILFPNVSGKGEGGELIQGDMLQLGTGKFPKGTVIGFFLISNGWNNGSINYQNTTFYTDPVINPEGAQQHILFKEKNCGDIVLGFEDMQLSKKSDQDYNDILFTISDNKEGYQVISFDTTNLPIL